MTVRVYATLCPPTTVPARSPLVDFTIAGAGSTTSTRAEADPVTGVPAGSLVGVELNVAVFVGAAPWELAGSVARTRARIVIRNTWSVAVLLLYTGGNRRVGRSPVVSRVTPGGRPAHGPLALPVADQSADAGSGAPGPQAADR